MKKEMINIKLKEYTQSRVNKLSRLSFPETKNDPGLNIQWIRWIAFENSDNVSRQKHKHSFYEAHFVLSGTNTYTVNGNADITLDEGEGLIIAPNTPHKVQNMSQELTKLSITFSFSDGKDIFSKSALYFKFNSSIIAELNGILKEAETLDRFSFALIRNRIFSILCETARLEPLYDSTHKREDLPMTDIRIASAKQYVEDNKNLFLSCKDVASYCHFNVKYLNRIFKAQMGQTLLEYVHEVKRKEAERLLRETELPLSEIAIKLGFSNEYYFNSFFKRTTTLSPGAYRKMIKK